MKNDKRYGAIIRNITGVICFLPLLAGCDDLFRSPQKPKVVRKKIITQKGDIKPAKAPIRQRKTPLAKRKSDAGMVKSLASIFGLGKDTKSSDAKGVYDPKGKIDPFMPLFREEPVVKVARKKKRLPRTPLEKIDLSQLRLVGIIRAPSGNKALVEEASGKGYIIKKGTRMGRNSGRVVQISKRKVIIEEEGEDVFGKLIVRQKELNLQKPPGE